MQTKIEVTLKHQDEEELLDLTYWLEDHINVFIDDNEINAHIDVFQPELNPDDLKNRKPEPTF
jgi:hypothetical protein